MQSNLNLAKKLNLFIMILLSSHFTYAQGSMKVITVIDNVMQRPIPCHLIMKKNNKDVLLGKSNNLGLITLNCENLDSIQVIPENEFRYYNSRYYNCANLSAKIIISNKYQYAVLNKKIDSLTLKNDYLTAAVYYNVLAKSYSLVDSNKTAEMYKQLSYQAVAKHLNLDKSIKYVPNSSAVIMSDKLKATLSTLQKQNGISPKTDRNGNLLLDNKTLELLMGRPKYDQAYKTMSLNMSL